MPEESPKYRLTAESTVFKPKTARSATTTIPEPIYQLMNFKPGDKLVWNFKDGRLELSKK